MQPSRRLLQAMTGWIWAACLGVGVSCAATGAAGGAPPSPPAPAPAPAPAALSAPAPGPQVLIPAGTLQRGFDASLGRSLILHAYHIDQDEVTVGEYAACVKAHACPKPAFAGDDTLPVRGVSWSDAAAYCKFVGRRLPTEAEWERAAFPAAPAQLGDGPLIAERFDRCTVLVIGGRAGKRCPDPPLGPMSVTRLDPDAGINNYPDQARVGEEKVYDLFGNVAEWVADWDDLAYYAKTSPVEDPQGPPEPKSPAQRRKVIRGGSFASTQGLRQNERRSAAPTERLKDVGFRCAQDVK